MKESNNEFNNSEWAVMNANFLKGCRNDCKYCYAKAMAIQYNRKTPSTWANEEVNQKNLTKAFKKVNGRIMFPSSHDISSEFLSESISFLENMLKQGNDVLIVTKPHLEVIKQICSTFSDFKEKILFRFTIGSTKSDILAFWEPGAPSYEERKQCLEYAFKNGFKTSVSCEPMLDSNVIELVSELQPYVTDAIWIGKVNALKSRMKLNGISDPDSMRKADLLIKSQSDENIKVLYNRLCDNPQIKWKSSIKKVMNLEISTIKGCDK